MSIFPFLHKSFKNVEFNFNIITVKNIDNGTSADQPLVKVH